LARLPDAPAGIKGISLFLVPKFLPDENGDPVNAIQSPAHQSKIKWASRPPQLVS